MWWEEEPATANALEACSRVRRRLFGKSGWNGLVNLQITKKRACPVCVALSTRVFNDRTTAKLGSREDGDGEGGREMIAIRTISDDKPSHGRKVKT